MGEIAEIRFAEPGEALTGVREMVRQYLEWDLAEFETLSGTALDTEAYLAMTFDGIAAYMPPAGRLALARAPDGRLLGTGFLKPLGEGTCEIKRLYVDPSTRGTGLGKHLLTALIGEARAIGYSAVVLDTVRYMTEAQGLYRTFGFVETPLYPGSENDPALAEHFVFMRLDLG